MLACDLWLRTDFLRRAGFQLTTRQDGTRTATRGPVVFPWPPPCGHPHCPPHHRQETNR